MPHLAVKTGCELQVVVVQSANNRGAERAKSVGSLCPKPLQVLLLPDSLADVVSGGDAENEFRGGRLGHASCPLPKHDDKLADPQSKRKPDELTPPYARNEARSIKPEILVAVGICSHLGCSPSAKLQAGAQPSLPDDWPGGFFCPCHGSMFDLAGRVYKNVPAPDNLEIPPHMYLSDTKLLIGEDKKA